MIRTITISVIVAMLILSGCFDGETAGTGAGNPGDKVETSFTMSAVYNGPMAKSPAAASISNFSLTDLSGTVFSIRSVRLHIRDIRIDLPDQACPDDLPLCSNGEVRVEGPFVIDLISKEAVPPIPSVLLPSAAYKRVDVRLEDADPADGIISQTDILNGRTMVIMGRFTYQGVSDRKLTILLNFSEDARFENDQGVQIDTKGISRLIGEMDASKWLSNIDITGCLDSEELSLDIDGNLTIHDNACGDMENIIKENIKTSGQLK